jgi:hypothetical protein
MNRVCTKLYLEKQMLYRDIPRYTELPNAIPSYTELYPSWYVPSYTQYDQSYPELYTSIVHTPLNSV